MYVNGLVVAAPATVTQTGGSSTATINSNGSVSFNACQTLSLNGVFTTEYDNYMVVMRYVSTGSAGLFYRLRASNVDNSTANSYTTQSSDVSNTTFSQSRTVSNMGICGALSNENRSGLTGYIFGPRLAQPTVQRIINPNGIATVRIDERVSTHNQSIGYDGITFICESTFTLSGNVTVFGFNQ